MALTSKGFPLRTLLLLIALTGPAAAGNLSTGSWHSDDRSIAIAFNGMSYYRYDREADSFITCEIVSWPINTPEAQTECEDGKKPVLTINADSLLYDGTPLTQSPDALD